MPDVITNKKFLSDIKEGIKNYGVYLVGVYDHNTETIKHDSINYRETADAWIYTIGHAERGRPDLLLFAGPALGEKPFHDEQEMGKRIMAAGELLNFLVDDWNNHPVRMSHTAEDCDGRMYRVSRVRVSDAFIRKTYTIQAGNYYGHNKYKVLVLIPIPNRGERNG